MVGATVVDLRDAIYDRIQDPGVYATQRKTPVPTLQADRLPALSVFILGGSGSPDGDANVGDVRLINDETIAISIARRTDDPVVAEGKIDAELDGIKAKLFTDPTFVHFGNDAFFESLVGTRRRWIFPRDGDSYFIELQFEMTFRKRERFEPVVEDDYKKTTLTTRQLGKSADTPAITTVVDEAT